MAEPGSRYVTRRQCARWALSGALLGMAPPWLAGKARKESRQDAGSHLAGADSLRAHAAARGLFFGAAVDPALLEVESLATGRPIGAYTRLFAEQAGILVTEEALQWAALRPAPGAYDFTQADRLFRFAALCRQQVRGHALCSPRQLPGWFAAAATRENARRLLEEHIRVVAGRYGGQMHSWDVVNEAILPADGRADGLRRTPWLELIGPEYVELAFRAAAAADPRARLTLNEGGIELDTAEQATKRGQLLLLLRRLRARQVPIHSVGIESHLAAGGPQPGGGLIDFVRACAQMDLEVYITELDVNTSSLAGDAARQDQAVAAVYAGYLSQLVVEPNLRAVLTAGLTSRESRLNRTPSDLPRRPDGLPQRPLPFDGRMQPTAAFWALRAALDGARPARSTAG